MAAVRIGLAAAVLFALAAAAASAQPGRVLTRRPATFRIEPRIVVQASQHVVETAAFSGDGRTLFTASGAGLELLVWDVETGTIVDRRRLPSQGGAGGHFTRFTAMRLSADRQSLLIEGEGFDLDAPDRRGPRSYVVDVATRRISRPATMPPLPPLPAGEDVEIATEKWQGALDVAGDPAQAGTREAAAATALLPALPASPDGQWQVERAGTGLVLRGRDGSERTLEAQDSFQEIEDAAMSPDGRRLVFLHLGDDEKGKPVTRIDVMTPADGTIEFQYALPGTLHRVHWLGTERIALLPQHSSDDPRSAAARGKPDLAQVMGVETGLVEDELNSRCFMTPLARGSDFVMIGAGLANCRSRAGNDRALVRREGTAWQPVPGFTVPAGADIRRIIASPTGQRAAVVTRLADGALRLSLIDTVRWQVEREVMLPADDAIVTAALFSRDGRFLWLAHARGVTEYAIAAAPAGAALPERRFAQVTNEAGMLQEAAGQLLVAGDGEDRLFRIDLASGRMLPDLDLPGVIAAGLLPAPDTRPAAPPLLWLAGLQGDVTWVDLAAGRTLFTTSLLVDMRFVTVAPDGRYDTNNWPDSESFRWFIPDTPFQSLPSQTFMRDYFEPRLHRKLIDCTRAGTCATALKPVRSIMGLNRVLPKVTITGVRPDPDNKGDVWVDIEAEEGIDPIRRTPSGLFAIKLMVNDREVARFPDDPNETPPQDMAEWRQKSRIAMTSGRATLSLSASIPSDGKPVEFSAYAFNSDRVKSNNANLEWTPPASARPRRARNAYVLAIGVNQYDEKGLDLSFAEADAHAISGLLASIPGYQVRRATLTSSTASGAKKPLTAEHVQLALSLLGGLELDGVDARKTLTAAGHNVSALDQATPDDIVIISFSGHGYADATGRFALLASDASWPDRKQPPDSVVSADDLAGWLRYVNAGEMTFIIDACHAGASVETPDFKPGPMGDASLGQLAYDKSMRILAATQANDVALENGRLQKGLLTHTLEQALTPDGSAWPADGDGDGIVRLSEWLSYAVKQLPAVSRDAMSGGGKLKARGMSVVFTSAPTASRRVQEPSLFDYDSNESPVILRGGK